MHIVQAERASLASYNISRKLVRPSQFLENFTQILTWSTLQKKNQVPSPYSILQQVERIGKRNLGSGNCLSCLPTIVMIGGEGVGLKIYKRYHLKK